MFNDLLVFIQRSFWPQATWFALGKVFLIVAITAMLLTLLSRIKYVGTVIHIITWHSRVLPAVLTASLFWFSIQALYHWPGEINQRLIAMGVIGFMGIISTIWWVIIDVKTFGLKRRWFNGIFTIAVYAGALWCKFFAPESWYEVGFWFCILIGVISIFLWVIADWVRGIKVWRQRRPAYPISYEPYNPSWIDDDPEPEEYDSTLLPTPVQVVAKPAQPVQQQPESTPQPAFKPALQVKEQKASTDKKRSSFFEDVPYREKPASAVTQPQSVKPVAPTTSRPTAPASADSGEEKPQRRRRYRDDTGETKQP